MTRVFSDAEARMLDSFGPPPLAPGFADRVTARLSADILPPAKRRDPRGSWRRGRVALFAAVGGTLLSVGAAAAGLLGARMQSMPVITTIAEAVDAPRAAPTPAPTAQRNGALAKSAAAATGGNVAAPIVPPTQQNDAELLADRIEARMKRRDALGLSVPSLSRLEARRDALTATGDRRAETMAAAVAILASRADAGALPAPRSQGEVNRTQWRARMAALSPEDRAAAQARREWRRQQQMAAGPSAVTGDSDAALVTKGSAQPLLNGQRLRERWIAMTPEQRAEWRARRAAREALMTPQQRQQLQERREQRRRQTLAPHDAAPEPMPPEAEVPQ